MAALRRSSIATQLIVATSALMAVLFAGAIGILGKLAADSALKGTEKSIDEEVRLMAGTADSYFAAVRDRGEREFRAFENYLPGKVVETGGTMRTGDADLPVLKAGSETLNGNRAPLEGFKNLFGSDAAILSVRDGRVLRTATLLKKDGRFMDGTEIPAGDPVAKALAAGQSYQGLTFRTGKYYFSNVKPLKDASGRVFAALSVRIDVDPELKQIRELFGKVVAGKTGYVIIIRPTGDDKIAEFVLHPKLQGQNVVESSPPALQQMIKGMIDTKSGVVHYEYPDAADGGRIKPKILVHRPSETWNWVIASGSFVEEFTEEAVRQRNLLLITALVIGGLFMAAVFFLIRNRLAPLAGAVEATEKLGAGDLQALAAPAAAGSANEVDKMADSLSRAVNAMREMIGQVDANSDRLLQAAADLESSAEDTLTRIRDQATSASGLAASVEQVSVSISHTADNARDAAEVTGNALAAAETGRTRVNATVGEMERIAAEIQDSAGLIQSLGNRSAQISAIISVIKDIADQTNLLALNAAIEAARAGEQGRGFAVVADEVRKLAERTSVSAQEIAETIANMVRETDAAVGRMQTVSDQMSRGVDMAREAGEAIREIDRTTNEASRYVSDIAAATREQSTASQEMARLVERVAQVAEQNAGAVVASAEKARQMKGLAAQLESLLGRFRL
ncbi:MAG TPA: methyl-accepting chemotaxis protein [Rhodocyclaceae bacterium]|nr:methyl-accepting chemotaxis protein [Rhodocyclaceae bacterium]HNH36517.1 methyl-accepting chemotaxis protein [Rhodocyclaceae bacterium]